MISLKRVLILGVVAPLLGLAAVACSDDTTSDNSAQQSDIDTLNARVQRDEVLFAIKAINDVKLHEVDEGINAGEVGNDFLPRARQVVRTIGLTNWPAELEEGARGVQDAAIALVAALDDGDIEAAKQPATEVHEGWHDFADVAFAHAAEGADLPPEAGIEEEHEAGDGTPAADDTPAEGSDDTKTPAEQQ